MPLRFARNFSVLCTMTIFYFSLAKHMLKLSTIWWAIKIRVPKAYDVELNSNQQYYLSAIIQHLFNSITQVLYTFQISADIDFAESHFQTWKLSLIHVSSSSFLRSYLSFCHFLLFLFLPSPCSSVACTALWLRVTLRCWAALYWLGLIWLYLFPSTTQLDFINNTSSKWWRQGIVGWVLASPYHHHHHYHRCMDVVVEYLSWDCFLSFQGCFSWPS